MDSASNVSDQCFSAKNSTLRGAMPNTSRIVLMKRDIILSLSASVPQHINASCCQQFPDARRGLHQCSALRRSWPGSQSESVLQFVDAKPQLANEKKSSGVHKVQQCHSDTHVRRENCGHRENKHYVQTMFLIPARVLV